MSIKINNAAKIAKCGKFPRTFAAVLAAIPAEVIDSLTAKNLASLADAMDAHFKAGMASAESEVEAACPTEIASEVAIPVPTPTPAPAPVQYFVYNAFDVRDDMIRAGALWIPAKKAWLITKKMFDKFEARTGSWGMAWVKGWAKTRVEKIAG